MLKRPSLCLIVLYMVCSCCSNQGSKNNNSNKTELAARPSMYKLDSPKNGSTFKSGDMLPIGIKSAEGAAMDSCVLLLDGKRLLAFTTASTQVKIDAWRMGMRRISLQLYSADSLQETLAFTVKVMPKNNPTRYSYKVVREYPHDDKAYTQGLCYHNGFLYEGTGQLRQSSLRKVKFETGTVLQRIALDDQYFGEGICIWDNKIIQLTWENRVGFIYNLDTFEKQGTFKYPTEGWGLTTDGKQIWMSDGTSNIYLLNPTSLEIIDQFEVYNNSGPVKNLNELEYINNEIWANVYGEDYIMRIDPKTGEVMGVVDLSGILKKEYYTDSTDVLNGIAYDAAGDRIFVTGKNWPKLFEIKLTK